MALIAAHPLAVGLIVFGLACFNSRLTFPPPWARRVARDGRAQPR